MGRVNLTADALDSLRRHDVWLRERDPRAAEAVRAEVGRVATLLGEHPLAGPAVEGRPYRRFVTQRCRYRLVYLVEGVDVEVIDVLHPSQAGP